MAVISSLRWQLSPPYTAVLYTLQPDGNIYPLLRDSISPGATDLTLAFNANQTVALQELVYTIENLVYHITDIMVR